MRDFLVIGGGSAGCVLAGELARRGAGRVTLLEAGPSHRHPLVTMPFGLVWLLGGARDWAYLSTPQAGAGGRQIKIPRGRMLGGSGSINSMVWFRGRAADFDGWQMPGWGWDDVRPAFEAIEARLTPRQMQGAHPLSQGLATMLGGNAGAVPSPDYESAGLLAHNMDKGRRRAGPVFLDGQQVDIITGAEVDHLLWSGDRATGARLVDGSSLMAAKGVVLAAGAIGSPAILMRSGIGPAADLAALGIDPRLDAHGIGANLHDHPSIGLHFEGPASGYGLEPRQWPAWMLAPLQYALTRRGRLASPTVEAGAFFNARGDSAAPDVQTHFIPFHLAPGPRGYPLRAGYFADVCLCRPKSRGSLRLTAKDPKAPPQIDLGLLSDPADSATLLAGLTRLRDLLKRADFGPRRAPEILPGNDVTGAALAQYLRAHVATAYHPVGTLRMGGPVTHRLQVKGTRNLWVADASIMPQITSANTNAPAMMIGWKAAQLIADEAA